MMRIAVAMSGGVDSSVAAALLKEQGHEVFGLTMLLRDSDNLPDARGVADHLGIAHSYLDFKTLFSKEIIDYFALSYAKGETPNPCVRCNRFIKLGALMDQAISMGAEALATGHYVRLVKSQGGVDLYKGVDQARDQSYFLFALSQTQLNFLRVPLADYDKRTVREIAARYAIAVAQKPDSQDICFVPDRRYMEIVRARRPEALTPGSIVDWTGAVVGRHNGVAYYTVGQRRGLNLGQREGDHNEPLFVVAIDPEKNQVVVGPRESLAKQRVYLRDVNWLGPETPSDGALVHVRLRSSQTPSPGRIWVYGHETGNISACIHFDHPQYGVARGQGGVAYDGDRLLGGGWIEGAE